jgi:predicted MFS family arabinose efflux permease
MSRFTRIGLGTVTALTMAVSTFPQVVFGVLAVDLIATFDVSRWQIGALVSATGLMGALLAPSLGRLTDRLGSLQSTRAVLILAFVSFLLIAVSPSYILLVAATLISGAPQGWCNPATNTLIAEEVARGDRGIVTGVKQSGVQAGTFLGGLLLPLIASAFDWRAAVAAFIVMPLVGVLGTLGKEPHPRMHRSGGNGAHRLPPLIRLISIYGLLAGIGTSAMLTFLPLFAAEGQGWSAVHAGWLLAGVGLTGVAARIVWGRIAESRLGYGRALEVLALLTVVSATLLALMAANLIPSTVLPLAAVLLGAGGVSWNSVGMLAVMERAPSHLIGRGTGVVLFGFLLGYGLGAPLFGLAVDRLGTYVPGWIGVSVCLSVAFGVATMITRLEPAPNRA